MRLAMLAMLVACGQPLGAPKFRAAGNASPRDGGTLHIATVNNIISLDPAIQYDEISSIAVHAMHDTLVGYAPDGALVPHLADRWDVSADGLTYRFTLRAGVVYADGTPIVAADFAYSLARVREMPDSPFGTFISGVTKVGTPSSRELELTLSKRDAAFLYVMAMPFTTPQRKGERPASGPFTLVSWREGERVELAKNARYWDAGNVHLDRIEWLENIPRETQFLMLERGDLDTVDKISTPDYLWLVEQPAWRPLIHRKAVR
jgi:peptide/nickel transport system substrate-binding protein